MTESQSEPAAQPQQAVDESPATPSRRAVLGWGGAGLALGAARS